MRGRTPHWLTITLCCAATIAAGAVVLRGQVPGTQPSAVTSGGSYDWAKWRQYWAFQPVRRPKPPQVASEQWTRNPIDRFVLAQLEEEGLAPAREADKLTLLRRATFDLTGLPPTPQEVRAFLADKSPVAYEMLIDRLLASPHY